MTARSGFARDRRQAALVHPAHATYRPAPWRSGRHAGAATAYSPAGDQSPYRPRYRAGAGELGAPIQRVSSPLSSVDRSSSGTCCRTNSASRRAHPFGQYRASRTATARQPARAANRPCTAACQHRGMIAKPRGFPDHLVDDRVERYDAPDEFTSKRLRPARVPFFPMPMCW